MLISDNNEPATIHDLDKARRAANLARHEIVKRQSEQRAHDRRTVAEYRDGRKARRFAGSLFIIED
jgi:hypothetical protein